MKTLGFSFILTATAFAQNPFAATHLGAGTYRLQPTSIERPLASPTSYRASQAAFVAATVVDVLSSRGRYEINPLLGTGQFTVANQGAKLMGITGGVLLVQELLVRKFPRLRKGFMLVNFMGASSHGYAAAHNFAGR